MDLYVWIDTHWALFLILGTVGGCLVSWMIAGLCLRAGRGRKGRR